MEQQFTKKVIQSEDVEKPKTLRVSCELAPISDNPGWFWIGWSRPLTTDDFRQLRRYMLCWRVTDLDNNGTPGLEDGWRINGEGLEHASMLGYQIFIDGKELIAPQGNFRANFMNVLESRDGSIVTISKKNETIPCELGLILIKFLRPEMAILGADRHEYGPFHAGEVAAIPYIHAMTFISNGVAKIYDE